MTALTEDRLLQKSDGVELDFPVAATEKIFGGALACVNAAGFALEGSDTAGLIFQGVCMNQVDNSSGANGALSVVLRRRGLVLVIMGTAITQANVGDNVFLVDDQTVDLTANVTNKILCGIIAKYVSTTLAWIDIEPAIRQADVATHIADGSAAHAASAISFADSGNKTTATEVDAALDELYVSLTSAQGVISIPTPAFSAAGVALAAFSDGASDVPGYCVTAKGLGIRWNNHAAPLAVGAKALVPLDADVTANMVLNILAAKTGATIGDATKFTVAAYNNVVGALYDADSDFGGDSGAMTGDATAKMVQKVTLTLALANLPAAGNVIELTIKPKDGTLGTDDVILLAAWITYTKKILTS